MPAPTTHRHFPLMGATATPLTVGRDVDGAFEQVELVVGPQGRSPLHAVPAAKSFWVLDGTITIRVGEVELDRPAGSVVHVPAGVAHCYRNGGHADARVLVTTAGTGHVAFLEGVSALAADGPPAADAVADHARRHGVTILPAT